MMEESWILRRIPAFAGGRRREITTAPRVHFYDGGLRHSLVGQLGDDLARRPDRGQVVETWVFGRTKGGAEVVPKRTYATDEPRFVGRRSALASLAR